SAQKHHVPCKIRKLIRNQRLCCRVRRKRIEERIDTPQHQYNPDRARYDPSVWKCGKDECKPEQADKKKKPDGGLKNRILLSQRLPHCIACPQQNER